MASYSIRTYQDLPDVLNMYILQSLESQLEPDGHLFPQPGLLLMILSTSQFIAGFPFLAILFLSKPLSIAISRKMGQDLGFCIVPCSPKPASTAPHLQGTIPQKDAWRHWLLRAHFLSAWLACKEGYIERIFKNFPLFQKMYVTYFWLWTKSRFMVYSSVYLCTSVNSGETDATFPFLSGLFV